VGWLATEWLGRLHTVTGETCLETKAEFMFARAGRRTGQAGVRASVVAGKRRNGRGAKGGREVDA